MQPKTINPVRNIPVENLGSSKRKSSEALLVQGRSFLVFSADNQLHGDLFAGDPEEAASTCRES
jgi:hypothetical protein